MPNNKDKRLQLMLPYARKRLFRFKVSALYVYFAALPINILGCLLVLAVSTQPVLAVAPDPAPSEKPHGLPAGGGSGSGTVTPDLFTGTAASSIPIGVPSGRNGMQPSLALTYSSSAGNGWLGVGWNLDVGSITRKAKGGICYSCDDYVLQMGGSSVDLIFVGAEGNDRRYQPKVEGAYSRIKKNTATNAWEVTSKDGTVHSFGSGTSSRQYDPNDLNKVFKWALNTITDTHGNAIGFIYDRFDNQLYLRQVQYTTNYQVDPNQFANKAVRFYLDDGSRPDKSTHYTTQFPVQTRYRVKTIRVFANGATQRVYKLMYTTSPTTGRSILTSVQQFGKDADVNVTTGTINNEGTASKLPPLTLDYQQPSTPLGQLAYGSEPPAFGQGGNFVRSGDFTGDGRSDVLIYTHQNSGAEPGTVYLWQGTGTGFSSLASTTSGPLLNAWNHPIPGDYTGDGKTDLFILHSPDAAGGKWEVWGSTVTNPMGSPTSCSTASCFQLVASGNQPAAVQGNFAQAGDFNGDGKTDIFIYSHESAGFVAPTWHLWRSTGTGFTEIATAQSPIVNAWNHPIPGDYTGDGKTDLFILHSPDAANGSWELWASTATGTGCSTASCFSLVASGNQPPIHTAGNKVRSGDFNGDGLSDVFIYQHMGDGDDQGTWRLWLATGSGFTEVQTRSSNPSVNAWQNFVVSDYNADGKADLFVSRSPEFGGSQLWHSTGSDFVLHSSSGTAPPGLLYPGDYTGNGTADLFYLDNGTYRLWATDPKVPDLLNYTANGIGGTKTLEYTPSTQWDNTLLPFPVQTLSRVTTNDGNGNSAVTGYSYEGGYFYIPDKEFRGFHKAHVQHPPGANGEYLLTRTSFHQGNDTAINVNNPDVPDGYMKGKPYFIQTWAIDPSIIVKHSEVYTTYASDNTAPYFNPVSRVETDLYDGATTPITTRTDYFYDAYGNVNLEYQYGDYIDGNQPQEQYDDRTVTRTYTSNTGPWIVGLPLRETIYEGITTVSSAIRADTLFFYDSTDTCNTPSSNQTPTQGDLTRILRWGNSGVYPDTLMAYDPYGNLTCTRDANGNQTTTAYEGSYTFPVTTTSPTVTATNTTLTTTTTYYSGTTNNGLYGQVESVTDDNNNATTTTTYDTFGRVKTVTVPDGSTSTTSYLEFGQGIYRDAITTNNNQHIRTDTSAGLSSWRYFDGFGKTILAKSTGAEGKVLRTETQYDARGQVWKTSLPYVQTGTTPPLSSLINTVMTYDAQGRVIQTDYPDGTQTLACYEPLITVSIDPKDHKKRTVSDVYGRVREVDEYTGTFSSCSTSVGSPYARTYYDYDALGNLTQVTDDQNNVTEIFYDSLSRKIAMIDPDMGAWAYTYDGNGNLLTQTDAKGQTISFTYDELNRVKTKTVPDVQTGGGGLDPDLVAWYEMDESSGTTVEDSAGSNTATRTGPSIVTGHTGNGLSFDGSDYVKANTNTGELELTDMTLMAWVNLPPSATWRNIVRKGENGGLNYRLSFYPNAANWIDFNFDSTTGAYQSLLCTACNIPSNTWTHVAATYDSSSGVQKIYIDGVQKASRTVSSGDRTPKTWSNQELYVGYAYPQPEWFVGTMDDVKIFSRALTAQEISSEAGL